MKKLVSILGLIMFLAGGMTAFAAKCYGPYGEYECAADAATGQAGADQALKEAETPLTTVPQCADGLIWDYPSNKCVNDPSKTSSDTVNICADDEFYKTNSDGGASCVKWQTFCADAGLKFDTSSKRCGSCINPEEEMDSSVGKCINVAEYEDAKCKEDLGPEYQYDAQSGICFDPNVVQGTLLPSTDFSYAACDFLMDYGKLHPTGDESLRSLIEGGKVKDLPIDYLYGSGDDVPVSPLDVLACGIKTGEINLWMIPFYIKYLIQFLLSIAGLMAILSVILGGYFYMFSGISEDKERGKKAIMYGIAGFVLAITSWAIVNIILSILTR